jgi:hypothetical protein
MITAGIIQTTFLGAVAISYLVVRRLSVLVLVNCCMDTLLLVQIYLNPTPSTTP